MTATAAAMARPSFIDKLVTRATEKQGFLSPGALMAMPAAGALIGSGVGGVTAPSSYMPEGAARGLHTGLAGGLGAAGGYAAGGVLGKLMDLLGTLRYGKPGGMLGRYTTYGKAIGGALGGLGGTIWAHNRQPSRPWEQGKIPILEKLYNSTGPGQTTAPPFSQGYQGPAFDLAKSGSEADFAKHKKRLEEPTYASLTPREKIHHSSGPLTTMLGAGAGGTLGGVLGAHAHLSPGITALLSVLGAGAGGYGGYRLAKGTGMLDSAEPKKEKHAGDESTYGQLLKHAWGPHCHKKSLRNRRRKRKMSKKAEFAIDRLAEEAVRSLPEVRRANIRAGN